MILPDLHLPPPSPGLPPAAAAGASPVMLRLQQSDIFHDYRQAFETITGLPLVLRSTGSFRTPLQGSALVNPFCSLMLQANKTCAACLVLQQRLEEAAKLGPKSLQCYTGLTESAVPVRVGNTVIGYLQTGQVLLHAPTAKKFDRVARALGLESAGPARHARESAYLRTRSIAPAHYGAILRLLVIFAEHLATVSNLLQLRARPTESAVITKGRRFIAEHHHEILSLGDVARALNMSATYFCKVFKQSTGFCFTDYLSRARIESAKHSLLDAHMRVSEAAYAAGFQSLSQFNRVFRRVAGESPSSYRSRLHGPGIRPGKLG